MGVVRAVSGLILKEEFESLTGWTEQTHVEKYIGDTSYGISNLSTDRQQGAYALYTKVTLTGTGGPFVIAVARSKTLNIGSSPGRRVYVYYSSYDEGSHAGLGIPFAVCAGSDFMTHDQRIGMVIQTGVYWTKKTGTLSDNLTGNKLCVANFTQVSSDISVPNAIQESLTDYLMIVKSDYVKLSNLVPTMKVELYRTAGNVLLGSATVGADETSGSIDVSGEAVLPEGMYFKIYAPGGITLLETSSSETMCAGDEYVWNSGQGSIRFSSDSFIIYRDSAKTGPRKATITATLLDSTGVAYPGATLYFTTSRGSLSASSGVTDANGQVAVTLSGTTHGIAVVTVSWLGDVTVPAATGACTIHIFYEAETPYTTKPFQLFIEGIEYNFIDGRYARVSDNVLGDFEVELPEWDSRITKLGLVSIYRKGILDFRGTVPQFKHRLGQAEKKLAGPHVEKLLQNRVVILESYSNMDPTTIIADLLTKYPCGITAGNFATCDVTISFFAQNESLKAVIANICEIINWQYRINNDLTLDLASEFGQGLVSAEFIEGENILSGDNNEDYGNVKNVIHAIGATDPNDPTIKLTSTAKNEGSIQDIGLQEGTVVQTTIASQTTLNTATSSKKDRSGGTDYKPVPDQGRGGFGGGTGGGTGTGGSTHEVPV